MCLRKSLSQASTLSRIRHASSGWSSAAAVRHLERRRFAIVIAVCGRLLWMDMVLVLLQHLSGRRSMLLRDSRCGAPCSTGCGSPGYGEHRKSKPHHFDYTTCQNIYQRCQNRPRSHPEPRGVPRYGRHKIEKRGASTACDHHTRGAPALLTTTPVRHEPHIPERSARSRCR